MDQHAIPTAINTSESSESATLDQMLEQFQNNISFSIERHFLFYALLLFLFFLLTVRCKGCGKKKKKKTFTSQYRGLRRRCRNLFYPSSRKGGELLHPQYLREPHLSTTVSEKISAECRACALGVVLMLSTRL